MGGGIARDSSVQGPHGGNGAVMGGPVVCDRVAVPLGEYGTDKTFGLRSIARRP